MAGRSHWWTERWLRSPLFLSLSLFFFLFLWLPTYLPIDLSIYLSIYVCMYVCMYVSLGLVCVCLSIYLSVCKLENLAILRDFFIFSKLTASETQHFCETSSFFEVDNIKNEASLRDLLIFWSWPHQKRSNSARPPHFSKLTTSQTKQFCETSSIFNLTTSKTKQFCETSFKNGKLSAELTASYQCVLPFFQSTCRKYCACHEKVMPGHTKCCTCHAKSSQQTWRSDAPECNPSQEISALTS